MSLTTQPIHFTHTAVPLERLAGNLQLSESDKIAETSRQFEAIILRQILTAAQKPAFPSRFNSQSFSSGVCRDMMANQLADQISRSGSFGLAERLEAQLTRQLHTGEPAETQNAAAPASAQPLVSSL